MILQFENLSPAQRLAIAALCERSFPAFIRFFFQFLQGQKLVWNWHHTYLCDELQAVYEGDVNREIINLAPGATKTEIFSIHFPAWCILRSIADNRANPGSGASTRWLPISYSDDLVKENASRTRDILRSEEFNTFWPLRAAVPNQTFNWRFLDEHGNEHRLYGTSLLGQVMGRRAGFMSEGNLFTGALLIDDPLPTKDDGSFTRMNKANKALNRILRSRLARDKVPIIMIQQRIAIGDSTDYLMGEKTPDTYRRVKIPAVIDREYADTLPDDIRAAMVEATGFTGEPVSYWEWKEPTSSLLAIKKADPYLYSSQYQQEPDEAMLEGLVWRKEVEAMVSSGRVLDFIPIEPALPVNSYWDLGIDDDMTIWLTQERGFEVRLIAFYKNRDEGMEHYINWLHDFRDKFGVRFGRHHGPHDLAVRELTTGKSRLDTAKAMGIKFNLVERPQLKRDSIEATRSVFPRFWIDKTRCEIDCVNGMEWREGRGGWSAIKKYQREYDPDREVFKGDVLHNWASHPNDALQLIGLTDKDPTRATKPRPAMPVQPSSNGWMGT